MLKRDVRCASSAAIAVSRVTFDMRTFYPKDLTLIGCTAWGKPIFGDPVKSVENSEIQPLIAGSHPLNRIADGQKEFRKKEHIGRSVLLPPPSKNTQ